MILTEVPLPRYIAIDWDASGLRVVEASTKGGKAALGHTLSLAEPLCLAPADATAAGQRLKEQLKKAGIAAGPVLVCIGRDRAVFRDVRYPDVPAHEAPDIVHFQTVKELTFPAEDATIDYQATSIPWPTGEKRALVVVLRKEVLAAVKKLCFAAGLKLEGLTVRPFGLAANCAAQNGPNAGETVAALVLSANAGELCIFRDRELLFSRSLPLNGNGPTGLAPELRRSLAAFASQFPGRDVSRVFVAGLEWPTDAEALSTAIKLPVFLYAPTGKAAGEEGAEFAGAYGLIQGRAAGKPAINLATPKQSTPPSNRSKYYWIGGAAAAAVLLIGLGVVYGVMSSSRSTEIKRLQESKNAIKKELDSGVEVEKRLEAINSWANSEMVMLDELYDLVARFPDASGLRVTAEWTTLAPPQPSPQASKQASTKGAATTPSKPKLAPIGEIKVMATADRPEILQRLKTALDSGGHWKLDHFDDTVGTNQAKAILKVYRQKPEEYTTVLTRGENTTGPMSGGGDRRGPGGNRNRFPVGGGSLRPPTEGGRP
jgi:hypothetical protein